MNNLIIHALDTYDFVIYEDLYDLPKESPIRKKRETLEIIKDKFLKLWSNRFN
jgi:hypothetical protein